MRLTIPKLRMWHLLGFVAASAAFFSVMQFRWSVEDPGYALVRQLRSPDAAQRAQAAGRLSQVRPYERRAIAPLTEMLFDPDALARASAARALLGIVGGARRQAAAAGVHHLVGGEDGIESEIGTVKAALASALGDRDPGARLAIAHALTYLDGEPGVVIPSLLELARGRDAPTRAEAVGCLGQFARQSEPAREAVFAALGDADFTVRWSSVNSLACALAYRSMKPDLAPEPLLGRIKAALVAAADDENALVRAPAVRALGGLSSQTRVEIPRVIEALEDQDAEVRLAAALFLSWRRPGKRSPALIPALGRALTDSDARVRQWSASTLGRLGLDGEAALPSLRASADDPEEAVRERVAKAIAAIEKAAVDFRSHTLPDAIAELGDADPIVRALAASRLEDLGPRASEAVPALVRCLADREADVRRAAAGALGQLGPKAAVAIPTLAALAESDVDERVRQAAALSRSILLREGGANVP
jgi:HEAT repeat protein